MPRRGGSTPSGPLVSQLIGYSGPVSADDLEQLRDQGYLPDDTIGQAGVERVYETELRGQYGVEQVERDAAGRKIRVLNEVRPPIAGSSLELTIDVKIQREAEKALKWAMRLAGLKRGVFIVMNPQTGEILAMVSLPTYDDNLFARGISAKEYSKLVEQPEPAAPQPRHQRAVPARLDLQAGDRHRRARGRQDHARPSGSSRGRS